MDFLIIDDDEFLTTKLKKMFINIKNIRWEWYIFKI